MTRKNRRPMRQGDVLLIPLGDDAPPPGDEVPRDGGRVVLAYGELTGHAHAIKSEDATLFELEGSTDDRLLVALGPVVLQHEEHSPIEIPAGQFVVRRQREYLPEGARYVAD